MCRLITAAVKFLIIFMTVSFGVTSLALAQAQPPSGRRKPFVEVPFERDPPLRPHILVRARLNNSEPMLFLLDTGVDYGLIVFSWAADKLDLKPTGDTVTMNQTSKLDVLKGGTLEFVVPPDSPTFTLNVVKCLKMDYPAVISSYDNPKIAGIIGSEAVMAFSNRLDFDTKIWTVYGTGAAPAPSGERKTWKLPFTKWHRPGGGVAQPWAKLTVQDAAAKTLTELDITIDTGADVTVLPLAKSKDLASVPKSTGRSRVRVLDNSQLAWDALVPSLSIGAASAQGVEVAFRQAQPNALLGLNFLERFRVTFSPSESVLYLEERPQFKPRYVGTTNIDFKITADGTFVIDKVGTKLAQAAGAPRPGDKLLAIDGRNLSDVSPDLIYLLLNSYEGTEATLQVQTGSQPPRTVKVQRLSRYKQ